MWRMLIYCKVARRRRNIVTFATKQAQPSSKLGEAHQTLQKYRYHQYGKLSEGDRNAEAFWPGGCSIDFPSKGTSSDPTVKMLGWQNCSEMQTSHSSFLSPWMNLGIEKLWSWRGTSPVSQVQCYTHIPGRDKASLAFRFELSNASFRGKVFGDCSLNFVNPRVPISSPMKMCATYWLTNGSINIHLGRFAASAFRVVMEMTSWDLRTLSADFGTLPVRTPWKWTHPGILILKVNKLLLSKQWFHVYV